MRERENLLMHAASGTLIFSLWDNKNILFCSISPLRDQHLYNSDPLYLPEEKAFVTETQVIRETLW